MEGSEVDFSQVQLSSLTFEAQQALSYLLDSQKLLLSEGPDKLPRWLFCIIVIIIFIYQKQDYITFALTLWYYVLECSFASDFSRDIWSPSFISFPSSFRKL